MAQVDSLTSRSKVIRDAVRVEIRPPCLAEVTQRPLPSHTTATPVGEPTLGYGQLSLKDPGEVCLPQAAAASSDTQALFLEWTNYKSFLFCQHSVLHLENIWKKDKFQHENNCLPSKDAVLGFMSICKQQEPMWAPCPLPRGSPAHAHGDARSPARSSSHTVSSTTGSEERVPEQSTGLKVPSEKGKFPADSGKQDCAQGEAKRSLTCLQTAGPFICFSKTCQRITFVSTQGKC